MSMIVILGTLVIIFHAVGIITSKKSPASRPLLSILQKYPKLESVLNDCHLLLTLFSLDKYFHIQMYIEISAKMSSI
jgi:hypothetical protein